MYLLKQVRMQGRVDTLPQYRTQTTEYRSLVYHRTWFITLEYDGDSGTQTVSTLRNNTRYFDRDGESHAYVYPNLENSKGRTSAEEGVHYIYEPSFVSDDSGWSILYKHKITDPDTADLDGSLDVRTKYILKGVEKYWQYQSDVEIDLED